MILQYTVVTIPRSKLMMFYYVNYNKKAQKSMLICIQNRDFIVQLI